MIRRLYFTFPSADVTQRAVDELQRSGINRKHMHALARNGVDLANLPPSTANQRRGLREHLALLFWRTELILFFLAFVVLVLALVYGLWLAAGLALLVMLLSFASGAFYAIRVPETTLQEHRGALAHNEVLLLVDVPKRQVVRVEDIIHRHHPAAVAGGSSWTFDALGI